MSGAKVMIVEDTPGVAKLVAAYLEAAGFVPVMAQNGQEALDLQSQSRPDIFVIDVMMPGMDGFELTRRLRADKRTSTIPILILTARDAIDDKIRGFEAGADDYMVKPFEAPELLARVRALLSRRAAAPAVEHDNGLGAVVASFGLRGGAGRSVLAANLAVALGTAEGHDVAACDLSLESGHLALMLDARPLHTIDQLITRYGGAFEPDVLAAHLSDTRYHVQLLAAPMSPATAPLVTAEGVRAAVEMLRHSHPLVVLDLAPSFSEVNLGVLESADVVLVVSTPEVAGVRAAAATLEVLETLGFPQKDTLLIMNQVSSARPLADGDIRGALDRAITATIPHDARAFVESLNKGAPLVVAAPRSAAARVIADLAAQLAKRAVALRSASPSSTIVR